MEVMPWRALLVVRSCPHMLCRILVCQNLLVGYPEPLRVDRLLRRLLGSEVFLLLHVRGGEKCATDATGAIGVVFLAGIV